MTKALMVFSANATGQANGNEANLFGAASATTGTEANTQAAASQDATFSKLGGNVISGGSGTNNIRFRDAGANGNQLASVAGTGLSEDAVNTDALSAADLFNIAFTDDGTNPTYSWIKANVEFASGHGCFHGNAKYDGRVFDAASETRFIAFSGGLVADGSTTEANVAFKNRAYDTFAAMQVRATANARTNDSIFKNRIASGDGSGVITFGAGVTGLLQDTAIGDSIADGAIVCASITLDTGVEDLTVSIVGCTLTSSTKECECLVVSEGGIARAASATAHYLPLGGLIETLTAFTEAQARVKPGFAGTARNLRCYLSANTYSVNGTLKLFVNGVEALSDTITLLGGAGWFENAVDTVSFDDNDELSFEFDEGTTGSITIHQVMITLQADSGVDVTLVNPTLGHTADPFALTQVHNVTLVAPEAGHTATPVTLTQAQTLVLVDAEIGHTATPMTVYQVPTIDFLDGATLGHTATPMTLQQAVNVTLVDATIGHEATPVTLHFFESGTTPDERILRVRVEVRTWTVPQEDRTFAVPREDRTFDVPSESRTFTVRRESRTFRVPPETRTLH